MQCFLEKIKKNKRRLFIICFLSFSVIILSFLLLSNKSIALETTPILGTASVINSSNPIYFTSDTYNANVMISEPDLDNNDRIMILGYAWSVDLGWIEFSGENSSGVYIESNGLLTGSAYIILTGRSLDFDNNGSYVEVDVLTGEFSGHLWSEDMGWIDFENLYVPDLKSPTGSLVINQGLEYTSTMEVSLEILAQDDFPSSGLDSMMICNSDTFSGCDWEDFSTESNWTLPTEDGVKTVYIKLKDSVGNESEVYFDSIILDTIPPICGTWEPSNPNWTNENRTFMLSGSTDTGGSGILVSGGSCEVSINGGTCTVNISDSAGNSRICTSPQAKIDTTSPTGSVVINSGANSTSTRNVTLTLSSTDVGSGVSQMRVCNNSSFSGCDWESYSTSRSWQLTQGDGTKTVYVRYRDNVGLVSPIVTDSIVLSTPQLLREEEITEEEVEEPEVEEIEETIVIDQPRVQNYTLTVVDRNGNPVKGAVVKLEEGLETETDDNGVAVFNNVSSGRKRAVISYDGIETEKEINVLGEEVDVFETVDLDMEIGSTINPIVEIILYILLGVLFLVTLFFLLRKKKDRNSN